MGHQAQGQTRVGGLGVRVRAVSALVVWVAVLATGCRPAATPGGCPDLTGVWALADSQDHDDSDTRLLPVVLNALADAAGAQSLGVWERLAISGDADRQLQFTLWRPLISLSDDPDAAASPVVAVKRWQEVLELSFTLKNGQHYHCKGGAMSGDWLKTGYEQPHARLIPREWQVAGPVQLSRASANRVEAALPLRQVHELTVWCGDGCKGIPYWISTHEHTDHWRAAPALPADARRFSPETYAVRKQELIRQLDVATQQAQPLPPHQAARQAFEQAVEQGEVPTGAQAAMIPKPGGQAADGGQARAARQPDIVALGRRVLALLPANVLPGPLQRESGGQESYRLTLFAPTVEALAQATHKLAQAPEFAQVKQQQARFADGMWVADVRFEQRHRPASP